MKEIRMNIPLTTSEDSTETGEMGQEYLVTGKDVAMRRWEEDVCEFGEERSRDYETVGCVLEGAFELDLDGESVKLVSGDSWLVPAGVKHRYRISQRLVAVEATSPPARFGGRDEPVS